jgi:RNA polymerase sigma factor (sigma-70 family)
MPTSDQGSLEQSESKELLQRFRNGDQRAATAIYDRYAQKLLALARRRLSRRVAARFDADDVVQSAYRSFFHHARDGEYSLGRSGDLWRLLASIILHKLVKQLDRHTAAKRTVQRETRADSSTLRTLELACTDPSPDEAVALADELQHIFSGLTPLERKVFELRLQGHELQEMAAKVGKSERTVRRILATLKQLLAARWAESTGEAPIAPAAIDFRSGAMPCLRFDDYLLQRLIGAGGMGKAYAAVQKRSNKPVAVKVLHKARLADPHAVARFVEESHVVARLRHPNIVAVHGLGRLPDGGYFMVFDLIEGQDLMRVTRQRHLPPEEVRTIMLSVADAIEHAHLQGVIHCDLKPSNVLVDDQGRISVADFGLARVSESGRDASADREYIAGTAGFMAPEQADSRFGPIDVRTDVYGLGGLLYCLLTGRAPFEGRTVDEIFRQLTSPTALPPRPSQLQPETPADLSDICMRCLNKQPERRFASAGQVAEFLGAEKFA